MQRTCTVKFRYRLFPLTLYSVHRIASVLTGTFDIDSPKQVLVSITADRKETVYLLDQLIENNITSVPYRTLRITYTAWLDPFRDFFLSFEASRFGKHTITLQTDSRVSEQISMKALKKDVRIVLRDQMRKQLKPIFHEFLDWIPLLIEKITSNRSSR